MTASGSFRKLKNCVAPLAVATIVMAGCTSEDTYTPEPVDDSWKEVVAEDPRLSGPPIEEEARTSYCEAIAKQLTKNHDLESQPQHSATDHSTQDDVSGCVVLQVVWYEPDYPLDIWLTFRPLDSDDLSRLADDMTDQEGLLSQCDLTRDEGEDTEDGAFCPGDTYTANVDTATTHGSFVAEATEIEVEVETSPSANVDDEDDLPTDTYISEAENFLNETVDIIQDLTQE